MPTARVKHALQLTFWTLRDRLGCFDFLDRLPAACLPETGQPEPLAIRRKLRPLPDSRENEDVVSTYQTCAAEKPLSVLDIQNAKNRRKLAMLTAYDTPTARIVDEAGVDMVLVGDSLGMVMLGREDTLSVTLDEMIHHCRAVVRGTRRVLVVADMPFMTYEPDVGTALSSAARLVREGGVRAVKLEGAYLPQIRALTAAGIPVMGHIGLTPQRAARLGGFKVQGKSADTAGILLREAADLESAGCFAVVLEAIPAPLAEAITARVSIPTIGIGAGAGCDGQVLVLHDMLGLYNGFSPRFVKRYAELGTLMAQAVREYAEEVRSGTFPTPAHSFGMDEQERARMEAQLNNTD